ncbi:hypothetical protein [Candidatus Nitrosacidococcus sp. I8]|uniref:hypothetical protein n=1 Tax=Candidatus Nitrosacidococcus sp. I8 TaxID=2942908 RepID=UPI0022262C4D|nr:hypothetical protein [Candidatus Nitrosacidococcus sp. I8]
MSLLQEESSQVATDTWAGNFKFAKYLSTPTAPVLMNGCPTNGVDAVSATLMRSAIMNQYTIDTGLNAGTDWVITQPTKWYYVPFQNPSSSGSSGTTINGDQNGNINTFCTSAGVSNPGSAPTAAVAPYTVVFNANGKGTAPEPINATIYGREEQVAIGQTSTIGFSPRPVVQGVSNALPYEVTVLSFNSQSNTSVLGSQLLNVIQSSGNIQPSGWVNLDLTPSHTMKGTNTFLGLPVIGFAVERFQNGVVQSGVLNNFGAEFIHTYERCVNGTIANGICTTGSSGTSTGGTGTGTSTGTSTGGTGTGTSTGTSTGGTGTGTSTGGTGTGTSTGTSTGGTGTGTSTGTSTGGTGTGTSTGGTGTGTSTGTSTGGTGTGTSTGGTGTGTSTGGTGTGTSTGTSTGGTGTGTSTGGTGTGTSTGTSTGGTGTGTSTGGTGTGTSTGTSTGGTGTGTSTGTSTGGTGTGTSTGGTGTGTSTGGTG